jgi:glycogen debranching enzyme
MLSYHPHIFKNIIIAFASTLRHSLIPNLLDNGQNCRYNSRDATWWFVKAVNHYMIKT